jgi:uroporphyrinogen-III decarboxylase
VILDEAHRFGMHTAFHSDGAIDEIIPDWIEIGLDILNPIQVNAMDIERVVREYGRHICFFGGVDIQHVLPSGTVEDVEEECRHLMELLGQHNGGYIASVSNSITPDTPIANIEAMCKALRMYGARR